MHDFSAPRITRMPYFFSLRRASRSTMLPSKMSVEMRRAFQMLDGGIAIEDEDVGAAARRDLAELVPAKLKRVVVGGGGERFARRESEAHQHFEFGVQRDAGHGAHGRCARGGQVMRIGTEDGLVDAPETHGRD